MEWIYYSSLTDAAKTALSKGRGQHGEFTVDKIGRRYYIAVPNKDKTRLRWYMVIKNNNPAIYQVDTIIGQ